MYGAITEPWLRRIWRPDRVLFVTDPERPQEAPAELLRRLYGLTSAGAPVLEALVAGNSLKRAAARLGIAYETARSHVKSVLDKTNTRRQVDVVKLVLSTSLWNHRARGPIHAVIAQT